MTVLDMWSVLGDPTRREILARVVAAPSSVTDLARGLPVSRPAVSQHLQVLHEAELVAVRAEGRRRIYQARPEGLEAMRRELETFWDQTLSAAKRLAEESYHPTEEEHHEHDR